MFESDIDIYEHIGQAMFNVLPDNGWDSAYFVFKMLTVDYSAVSEQFFIKDNQRVDFNVDEYEYSETFEAFHELYHLMQRDDSDVPWNKARFELEPNGNFDIQFRYDKDFAWLKSLNLKKKKDNDLYESIDIDVIDLIKSWDGLPEDFDRYWLK
ncbi:hypothetical protein C0W35_22015 [Photobacterium kishitanii]|uniref:immunity protein YezG family protein n=1 Tax=Photobacterium kishitanii TaxID=318456 RepID=UPI000D16102E|nr:immunity protein YezG family protein [Photobacterium kishitanii]PSU86789.1 hypothetical protein C0W35_22015 [Photobacterium kishitanii]